MTAPERTLVGYSDLAQTERYLGQAGAGAAAGRSEALALIAREVRERIDRELGVTWSGEEPVSGQRIAWGKGFETLALPLPAISVASISPVRGFEVAARDQATGYIRTLRITGNDPDGTPRGDWGGTPYTITGVWADRPGGNPPEAIVGFASAVTGELWRRRNAPAAIYLNPDGVAVGTPDPWANQGWSDVVKVWAIHPLGRGVS